MTKKTLIIGFVMVTDLAILVAVWFLVPMDEKVRNLIAIALLVNLVVSFVVLSQKRQW